MINHSKYNVADKWTEVNDPRKRVKLDIRFGSFPDNGYKLPLLLSYCLWVTIWNVSRNKRESIMSRPKSNLCIESSHTTNGRRHSGMISMISLRFPPVYFVELQNQEPRIYGSPYDQLVHWFVWHNKRTMKLRYYLYILLEFQPVYFVEFSNQETTCVFA